MSNRSKPKTKSYFTHDNGGTPFKVVQESPNVVRINVLEVTPKN